MRLADKVAIITGGGSGLGKAASLLFAQEGAKVVVAQRTVATAEKVETEIKKRGGKAVFVRTDVSVAADVQNLIKETLGQYGKIDILYNNAGIEQMRASVENIEESTWDNVFDINMKGYFLTAKYAIPIMKKARYGIIINVSSTLGLRPIPGMAAYCSTKGAIVSFTKALAIEVAPAIRANCICPAAIDTPLQRRLSGGLGYENFKKEAAGRTPMGRLANPEDVAYAALYLASDESKMITGQVIYVDGGRMI
ncbi:MAG: SDR family oxidoreductase [Chloroflexi bacterium]|nr:SDR family oxidoreductase [Chloroflexota bacterium]